MMKGRTIRNLVARSPRMSRTKPEPLSAMGSKTNINERPHNREQDTASCLEVTPLSAPSAKSSRKKLENTYKMDPSRDFRCKEVENEAEKIMAEFLENERYDPVKCKDLSQFLSAKILEAIKKLGFTKYKMVAVVSIGSMKEKPGMQFGSRCLWNKDTDNFISAKYSNTSIFAVAMVYGLFYE